MAHCLGGCLSRHQQQRIRLDPERDREAFDVVQCDIPGLALDMRDKGSVKPAFKSQRFLRPAFGVAQRHHVGRQQSPGAGGLGRKWIGR